MGIRDMKLRSCKSRYQTGFGSARQGWLIWLIGFYQRGSRDALIFFSTWARNGCRTINTSQAPFQSRGRHPISSHFGELAKMSLVSAIAMQFRLLIPVRSSHPKTRILTASRLCGVSHD